MRQQQSDRAISLGGLSSLNLVKIDFRLVAPTWLTSDKRQLAFEPDDSTGQLCVTVPRRSRGRNLNRNDYEATLLRQSLQNSPAGLLALIKATGASSERVFFSVN